MSVKGLPGWWVAIRVAPHVLLLALGSPAAAQETIYVAQMNPSQVHAFTFEAGRFVRQDLDPATSRTTLPAGVDPYDLQLTDRYVVTVSGLRTSGLGLGVVDSALRLELPRPRVRAASRGAEVVLTPDGSFALYVGVGLADEAFLCVVDLRPAAVTFLTEVAVLPIPTGRVRPTVAGVTLDRDGRWLFVAFSDSEPQVDGRRYTELRAVDVADATQPVLGPELVLAPFRGLARQLFLSRVNDRRFLFVLRRGLDVYEVDGDGSLSFVQVISSQDPQGRQRIFRDLVITGNRAFGATYVEVGGAVVSEELVVLDATWESERFAGTTLYALPLSGAVNARLRGSSSGTHLFALAGEPARLSAITATDAPVIVDSTTVDPRPDVRAVAYGLVARPALPPPPVGPELHEIAVDGVSGGVLVNDRPRLLTITGAGLSGVRHVFVGLTRAAVTQVAPDRVDAVVPPLTPAGTQPVIAVAESGAAAASAVMVANPPGTIPPYVAYATGFASNEIAILHAVDPSGTPRRVDTGQGPVELLVSPDGRWLFSSGFRGGGVSVHTLVADPERGVGAYGRVSELDVAGYAQQLALDPHRKRLYFAALATPGVCVADVDPASPTFLQLLDTDADPSTTSGGAPPGISCIDTRGAGFRGIALTPDGEYLYIGRYSEPRLEVVSVADDRVEPGDVTFVTIADAPPGGYRFDGLAVVPAVEGRPARLYASLSAESVLRVFDLTDPFAPSPLGTIRPPDWAPDIRRLASSPDGRVLYVSSRDAGTLDVFDTATDNWLARVLVGKLAGSIAVSADGESVLLGEAEDDAVAVIRARPGSPTRYEVVARSWGALGTVGVAVSPGLLTPSGASVSVMPLPSVTVTFAAVEKSGHTSVTSGAVSDVEVPEGFVIEGLPVFYEVRTTAVVTGPITVCLPYDDAGLTPEAEAGLRVLHEEGGVFVDRTVARDSEANVVCAEVTGLSQFVVVEDRRFETLLALILTDPGVKDALRQGLTQVVTEAAAARARGDLPAMRALLGAFETRVRAQSESRAAKPLIVQAVAARMIALARSLRASAM